MLILGFRRVELHRIYPLTISRGTAASTHNLIVTVNMDGWVLHDIYGGQDFTWHNFTIQPGQKIRVYTDEVHSDSGGFSFGSGTAIWANKGDAAELRDATGTVVSTFTYGSKR